jgi:NADH:ubiquinone oxidoreductase subunit 2 (subunit N)
MWGGFVCYQLPCKRSYSLHCHVIDDEDNTISRKVEKGKETTLIKFILFTSLVSLGGLPPFLGFLPK